MPSWVPPPPLDLQLWYGDVLVADLHQVFPHQGTWFAPCKLRIAPGEGTVPDQLLGYIAFCEDFHQRIGAGEDHDFAEFDDFGRMAETTSWTVPRPGGGSVPMEGRMWFADGQACWQHPETPPSTEAAANEVWARIARDAGLTSRCT